MFPWPLNYVTTCIRPKIFLSINQINRVDSYWLVCIVFYNLQLVCCIFFISTLFCTESSFFILFLCCNCFYNKYWILLYSILFCSVPFRFVPLHSILFLSTLFYSAPHFIVKHANIHFTDIFLNFCRIMYFMPNKIHCSLRYLWMYIVKLLLIKRLICDYLKWKI